MGKMKELTRIFRRYENKHLSLEDRFVKPEDKSRTFADRWNTFVDRDAFSALLHPIESASVVYTRHDWLSHYLIEFIGLFTNHEQVSDEAVESVKSFIIKKIKSIEDIVYSDRDNCTIKFKNGKEISFGTLSSRCEVLLEEFPDLITTDREGKCHMRSLAISAILDKPNKCVTSECWHLSPKGFYLHSYVELESDGGEMLCLDNNLNVVMKKEDYERLRHPRVIGEIDSEQIIADVDMIDYLNDRSGRSTPYIKLYCASRDEAVELYNKLLQEDDSKRESAKKDFGYMSDFLEF